MIGAADALPGTPFLLAQEGAQPPPAGEYVEPFERGVVPTEDSAHEKSRAASPPCAASSALPALRWLAPFIAHPPYRPPSLARVHAAPSARGPSLSGAGRSGAARAPILPGSHTPRGSLRFLRLAVRTSRAQPRYGPERRFRSRLNAPGGSCHPGFVMNEPTRRAMPPKRVRHLRLLRTRLATQSDCAEKAIS